MSDESDGFNQRLARLEAVVEGIAGELRTLGKQVGEFVSQQGRTNWSVLISGMSVLLTVVTLASGLVWAIVSDVESETRRNAAHIEAVDSRVRGFETTRWSRSDQDRFDEKTDRRISILENELARRSVEVAKVKNLTERLRLVEIEQAKRTRATNEGQLPRIATEGG